MRCFSFSYWRFPSPTLSRRPPAKETIAQLVIFYGSAQSWLQYSKTVLISSMKLLFVFHTAGLIISGGYGIISGGYKRAPTSIETFPTAQLPNCTIPSFHQCNLSSFSFIRCSRLTLLVVNRIPSHTMLLHPSKTAFLFSSQGRVDHSLSVVDNGRQLVACGGSLPNTGTSCISWRSGQDEWKEYATLRSYKDNQSSYQSLLSQKRWNHAAVVVLPNEEMIMIGGAHPSSRNTGEIVKSEFDRKIYKTLEYSYCK